MAIFDFSDQACQILPFPDDISGRDFESDFVWGAATSAYQIEGAASEGGKGPSIWDVFCLTNPGRIVGGDNGNNAVQAYYKTKVNLHNLSMISSIGRPSNKSKFCLKTCKRHFFVVDLSFFVFIS
ncbi:hypothetical protein R6Q57_018346 [Mikania cordata]